MALSQRLEFRQTQALVMTPQLMQAIKLLQLSSLDLAAYVEGELERNPLLERANDDDERPLAAAEPDASGSEGGESGEAGEDMSATPIGSARTWRPAAAPWKRGSAPNWKTSSLTTGRKKARRRKRRRRPIRNGRAPAAAAATTTIWKLSSPPKLRSPTISPSRWRWPSHDPAARMIGQYLIDMVDEAGYLTGDLDAVADKLGAPRADVEAVLAVLQTLDPPGVCARNLTECLAIQLKDRDRFDPAMQTLVEHLDLLAKRDLAALRRLCGVNEEDLADMIAEIRNLNPKPGLAFGSTMVQPIVPDVYVRAASDGTWQVELNSDTLPKVLISQRYYAQVSKTTRSDKDKTYLADCLQTATWLVRALDQRAKTILKVSSEIVRQQDAFFAHGVQHLRPLNLKTVADAIGMHELTVSRVTANKYMATSRGIFELKYFFTSSIASADGGEAHSAEAVRDRIRHLIDAETAADVLSDDTIVDKLREAGIDIARRTVAKYREAMRIPSSVQRRREKQAASV